MTTNATTTTTTPRDTTAALARQLAADGYTPGAPPWLTPLCGGIDREVCATSACDRCGHPGLSYRAFHRADPRSYVAVAVCPGCAAAFEF
jgi:hypothetical protein